MASTNLSITLASDAEDLERLFVTPPDDSRIMMRWWWFGPCVTEEELSRELNAMRDAGIGGVEVSVVYPMGTDGMAQGFQNFEYLGEEFLDRLGFASRTAQALGLRFDVTIGSGWSYGGRYITPDLASACLRSDMRQIIPDQQSVARPVPWENESLIAAYVGEGSLQEVPRDWQVLDISGEGDIALPPNAGPRVLLFVFSSRTGQMVKRAAVGAEGYILDHLNRDAIERHLRENGDRIMGAVAPGSVTAIFCDSLEVYDANWTSELFEAFAAKRGYDPLPLLPLLYADAGKASDRFRRDYYRTVTALYEENFMAPLRVWAEQHGVSFRIQNYGLPPASLASHRQAHLIEGEGFGWRELAETRWASSAAHLLGLPVTSSETWTWINSPSFRASPLDIKGEAHEHFLLGINQLIGHGWPYSPPEAGWPGWMLYAAGALNDANPWWPVMPELAGYLQRLSFVLRQGEPVADVALFAPTEDVYAGFSPSREATYLNLWKATREHIGPEVIPAILDAGYSFDLIDDGLLKEAGARGYKAVILPNMRYLSKASRDWLAKFAANGGLVLALGRRPDDLPDVEVIDVSELANQLNGIVPPDISFAPATPDIGFVHRRTAGADIYFVANTGNIARSVNAQFRECDGAAELWDAMTGEVSPLKKSGDRFALDLPAYGSAVLVFRRNGNPASTVGAEAGDLQLVEELADGWGFRAGDKGEAQAVSLPHQWNEDDAHRHFSGLGQYERSFEVADDLMASGGRLVLDFGEAVPATRESLPGGTMGGKSYAALVRAPVREAARILVNGEVAGQLWAPPYCLDITDHVRSGANNLRIEVFNSALNALCAERPDMQDVTAVYGQRARLQDFNTLEPVTSGINAVPRIVLQPRTSAGGAE